jgi:glutamate racemase
MQRASIGIFDSGFGGLTVMNAVKTLLPHENIIYFGDTARLPYGNKSSDTILKYSLENILFLNQLGIKLLIIACHTVCTSAFEELSKASSIPILGVVEPAIEELIRITKSGKVALLGTRRTVASGVYQQLIQKQMPEAELTAISCPLFVPLVEEGYVNHPITEAVVQEYLRPLKKKEIDTVLLGCTHYPLLQTMIQKELGESTVLIDPATSCAQQACKLLTEKGLLNHNQTIAHYEFYVSDDPEKFRLLGKQFLNYPIEHVFARKH